MRQEPAFLTYIRTEINKKKIILFVIKIMIKMFTTSASFVLNYIRYMCMTGIGIIYFFELIFTSIMLNIGYIFLSIIYGYLSFFNPKYGSGDISGGNIEVIEQFLILSTTIMVISYIIKFIRFIFNKPAKIISFTREIVIVLIVNTIFHFFILLLALFSSQTENLDSKYLLIIYLISSFLFFIAIFLKYLSRSVYRLNDSENKGYLEN
jgi:hypothetical protein